MTQTDLLELPAPRSLGLPSSLDQLLQDYPRKDWENHKNFKQATRNWLGAHQAFRRLSRFLTTDTEGYLDHAVDAQTYGANLSRFGNALIANLFGHHHWEDLEYFPELSAADPRFDKGLEILEKDHVCLNIYLEALTRKANRIIKLIQLDEQAAYDETGELLPVVKTLRQLLDRHLGDEEDLAVPIILHHRLRG